MHSGLTVPMRGPARQTDLISLSFRDRGAPASGRSAIVYMMCVQYWLKYCEFVDRHNTDAVPLTAQELECLKWCKEGKTNWEIGEILSISQKTVERFGEPARRRAVELLGLVDGGHGRKFGPLTGAHEASSLVQRRPLI